MHVHSRVISIQQTGPGGRLMQTFGLDPNIGAPAPVVTRRVSNCPPIQVPAACRECEHLNEQGGAALGYPPLCELVVNAAGQPCASAFDGLIRSGQWPADQRCPGRGKQ